jgi:hypothetical protein
MKILFVPSFYAHILSSFLILVSVILLYKNYSKIMNLEPYQLIMIILVFSISIGIHSISHLGLEKLYDFNPINDFIKILI